MFIIIHTVLHLVQLQHKLTCNTKPISILRMHRMMLINTKHVKYDTHVVKAGTTYADNSTNTYDNVYAQQVYTKGCDKEMNYK